MNIFLPEDSTIKSARALDDRRLNKQIIECKTICDVFFNGNRGYAKHPVVVHYCNHIGMVWWMGINCCYEYNIRFGKEHALYSYFDKTRKLLNRPDVDFKYVPFYCEGRKDDPQSIRTTENTVELFRRKLCYKWREDKIAPKWTNRQPPEWKDEYWGC